jgi:phosphate uptake regulator
MIFLNQLLAFGAAAFAIPLIIHILNRSRFQTIDWGAMHLLESVIKVNHKRFRIEQLILLLVRCAIPILLALCLARPVLTGSRILEGDAPVSMVILLDNSYSMDVASESGTQFDQAIQAASSIVSSTGRGSEISVILTGGSPTHVFDQPLFDSEMVVRKVKLLQGGYGASQISSALNEAFTTLSGMSHPRRELIVISDFQSEDWRAVDQGPESIQSQIESMNIKPGLTLLPISSPSHGNVSVESLDFSQRAIGVKQPLSVRANLSNHGDTPYETARVIMRIDDVESTVTQISLAAKGKTQVLFPCTFQSPGSHVMEVEVVVNDQLSTDNRYAAAVSVWDSVKVLLVDGDPSTRPLGGETDYLSVALSPFTFGRVRLSDLMETQTVSVKDFNEEILNGSRVVILANVSQLQDSQKESLTKYVAQGGALLICAGNRIDLNWYNTSLYETGKGLLPLPFGPMKGMAETSKGESKSGSPSRIVAQHFEHPALEFFNEPANGNISSAEIRQWYTLGDRDDGSDDQTLVLARLDSGDKFLVERSFGEGVVVQMATACDADWSDLPLKPVFVPMMQQLVSTMASHISPPRNISTGDPAVAIVEQITNEEQRLQKETVSIVLPDQSRRTIPTTTQGNIRLARYEQTQRPGTYIMSTPSAETIHFVVESSRSESDLTLMDDAAIETLSKSISASVVDSPTEYLKQDRLRRHGREIWEYILAALLAFMFLELILQQRFARFRT